MSWNSYLVPPLDNTPNEIVTQLASPEFWQGNTFTYRSVLFEDSIAEYAFPAGNPFIGPDRVQFRGLYLVVDSPSPHEHSPLARREKEHFL